MEFNKGACQLICIGNIPLNIEQYNNIHDLHRYLFDVFYKNCKQNITHLFSTVVIAYKNIVGSREKCSYNRYVLITDIYDL